MTTSTYPQREMTAEDGYALLTIGSLGLGIASVLSGAAEAAAIVGGVFEAFQALRTLGTGRALVLAGAGFAPQISNFLDGIVEMATGAPGGGFGIPRFSPQKQGRHVWDHPNYTDKSYFKCMKDAEEVFNAFIQGKVTILGKSKHGDTHFTYSGVTGYNHNPASGYPHQPTNTFFVKGQKGGSVVPTNPNWRPNP